MSGVHTSRCSYTALIRYLLQITCIDTVPYVRALTSFTAKAAQPRGGTVTDVTLTESQYTPSAGSALTSSVGTRQFLLWTRGCWQKAWPRTLADLVPRTFWNLPNG